MTGYPPKCPQNASRNYGPGELMATLGAWPGDTYTDRHGAVWKLARDGQTWKVFATRPQLSSIG